MNKNILICGVGGQGTVLAAKLAATAAGIRGERVHSAETIGMAQRGGSVTSHIRIGNRAQSPLIPSGTADLVLAFEPTEAVRNLRYLHEAGTVIVNRIPVQSTAVASPVEPDIYIEYLQRKCHRVIVTDSLEIAQRLGSPRMFNVAVLGVAVGAGLAGFDESDVRGAIDITVKEQYREMNHVALTAGIEIGGGVCSLTAGN